MQGEWYWLLLINSHKMMIGLFEKCACWSFMEFSSRQRANRYRKFNFLTIIHLNIWTNYKKGQIENSFCNNLPIKSFNLQMVQSDDLEFVICRQKRDCMHLLQQWNSLLYNSIISDVRQKKPQCKFSNWRNWAIWQLTQPKKRILPQTSPIHLGIFHDA